MIKAKTVAFVALMAALANVMSALAVPLPLVGFTLYVHFFQLAIFLCGILAGPWAGLLGGAVGGLYMGLSVTKIPLVIGGIAILGGSVGLFAKRVRPFLAGSLAWLVQAPYVAITDYVWFTLFAGMPSAGAWGPIILIMISLTLEALVCAILADVIIHYIRRAGISF